MNLKINVIKNVEMILIQLIICAKEITIKQQLLL